MSAVIKPVGDRLLVKIIKLSEKKIGEVTLTLANDMKKKYQAECCKAMVVAGGDDLPPHISDGVVILMRSDAGVGLTADVVSVDNVRLYRVIEYPEVIAIVEEVRDIVNANDVCSKMEVVA